MKKASNEQKLWKRDYENVEAPKGGLFDSRNAFLDVFQRAKRSKLLVSHPNDEALYTPQYHSYNLGLDAELHMKPNDPLVYVGIRNHKNDEPSHYTIDSDGVPVSLDGVPIEIDGQSINYENMECLERNTPEYNQLAQTVNMATRSLASSVERKKIDNRRKYKKIGMISIAGTGALLAVGGIDLGVKHFIIEPGIAADAERAEYDRRDYDLPGEGAPLDGRPFDFISSEAFSDIPNFGGSDKDLDNPRTIMLKEGEYDFICATVNAGVPDNTNLHVALPEGSIYSEHTYQTTRVDEDTFTICLTEKAHDSDEQEDVEVALQVREIVQ